jgi:hypothetical protein
MSTHTIPFNKWLMQIKNHGNGGYSEDDSKKWRIHGAYSLLNFAGNGKKLLVDKVIKLSEIDVEFPKVLAQLGIPIPNNINVPTQNIGKYTQKKHWKTYYDDQSKKCIQNLYGNELKTYNYTF